MAEKVSCVMDLYSSVSNSCLVQFECLLLLLVAGVIMLTL